MAESTEQGCFAWMPELAALHEALTRLRPLHRERDNIMTDSQTSLYLIMIALYRSEEMRVKKHREV